MTGAPATKADIRNHTRSLYDESEFDLWFRSPQALLEGRSTADMVDAGHGGEVLRLVGAIEHGAYL